MEDQSSKLWINFSFLTQMQKLQENHIIVKEFFKKEVTTCNQTSQSNSKNRKYHTINPERTAKGIIFNRLLPRGIFT